LFNEKDKTLTKITKLISNIIRLIVAISSDISNNVLMLLGFRLCVIDLKEDSSESKRKTNIVEKAKTDPWFIISNARYATQINRPWMSGILANLQADVVMVNVVPQLAAYREKVRMASESKVVGFRRLYCDSAQPAPIPADWPDHIFIKTNMLNKVLLDGALPIAFAEFIDRCLSNSLRVNNFDIGGMKLDLETEAA